MHTQHRRRTSKSILLPRLSTNSINTNVNTTNGQPNYARRMTIHLPETTPDSTYLYGYALLIFTFIMFTASFYSMLVSPYMPDTNIKLLDWVKYDNYYCLLLPITALVFFYWIMWNWMGMKFFRH
ncbi:phosphatidylinositol N-acetylglucosaminyltransferase subunit Y-domain-containing protein, partial [Helicostylum pulchrum]